MNYLNCNFCSFNYCFYFYYIINLIQFNNVFLIKILKIILKILYQLVYLSNKLNIIIKSK